MVYAALVSTVFGFLLAFLIGLARAWPPLSNLHDVLLIGVSVLLPVIGWTLGVLALGLGAIIGAACAASKGSLFAGLEWALVAGLGAALGLGVAYGSWDLVVYGFLWGAMTGGSVGLSTWLCCTDRETLPVERSILPPFLIALVLVALYVPLVLNWIASTPGG
jgi:hypothetical protein